MKFVNLLDSYTAEAFRSGEAAQAITEYKRHIPGRILNFEFDDSKSNKQGIKNGARVYKLGLDLATGTVFIEYFDNFNQGQPTMALYVGRTVPTVTVTGWQIDKRMNIRFELRNGVVHKTVSIDK